MARPRCLFPFRQTTGACSTWTHLLFWHSSAGFGEKLAIASALVAHTPELIFFGRNQQLLYKAANGNSESHAILGARLGELEAAAESGDLGTCTRCDMALHEAIWHQADNSHLLRVLDSVLGAIFVLCDRVRVRGPFDPNFTIDQHRQIVDRIVQGDGEGAAQAMEAHLRGALDASLRMFSEKADQKPQLAP